MDTFRIEMEIDVEASSDVEAEDILREILDAEPVVTGYNFVLFTKTDATVSA